MSFKRYLLTRVVTMFGVLMATLLLTIALVGSNMDSILNQSVAIECRGSVTNNPDIVKGMSTEELESYIQNCITTRTTMLGLDQPWYSPIRLGLSMYKILILDFGHATFLTSDSGSSDVKDILLEKLPRTILLFTTATVIISLIGIFLGALSASNLNSKLDRLTSTFAIISSSFPVWWIGMLMIFVLAFVYRIFPARATPWIPITDPGYIGAL